MTANTSSATQKEKVHLWLRGETKKNEARTALTPDVCRTLLETGEFSITVERCHQRIFPDSDYESISVKVNQQGNGNGDVVVKCAMVEKGTWPLAPVEAIIIGLKELPPSNSSEPLRHRHIFFAHCFKEQEGWHQLLTRFIEGNGHLMDLEFLQDPQGRRVAAFGYHAGFAGMALGLDVWSAQQMSNLNSRVAMQNVTKGGIRPYPNQQMLIDGVKSRLEAAYIQNGGRKPTVLVIGALGRCGRGACDFASLSGIPESHIFKWDITETRIGGPFPQLLQCDIFVNCIYLSEPIQPFLTMDMLREASGKGERRLGVVVDVSCDTTNPHNPIPIYSELTTFDSPTLSIPLNSAENSDNNSSSGGDVVEVVAIDHLPTLLPRESSQLFCQALLPSLLELPKIGEARVWQDALKLFERKCVDARRVYE